MAKGHWSHQAERTLLLGTLRLPYEGNVAGMRSSAHRKMLARLVQAELAIHSESNLARILIFLAVILPPADRAQLHGTGCRQRPESATWTAVAYLHRNSSASLDVFELQIDYLFYAFDTSVCPSRSAA
jgi:hypothetical protein